MTKSPPGVTSPGVAHRLRRPHGLGVALLVLANESLANILTVLFGEGMLLLAVPPSIAAIGQLRSSKTTT